MNLISKLKRTIVLTMVAAAAVIAVPVAASAATTSVHPYVGSAAYCYFSSETPYQIVHGGTVYATGNVSSCPVPPINGCKMTVDLYKSSEGVSGYVPVAQSNPGWTSKCENGSGFSATAQYKCLASTSNSEFYTETWLTIEDGGTYTVYDPITSAVVWLPCN